MNYRAIAHYLGLVLKMEVLFMLPPTLISIYVGAFSAVWGFIATMILMLVIGLLLDLLGPKRKALYNKEGFVAVAICWISLSVFGALPFWFSREIPSFIDALFESISGFTTTGASILTNVEGMSKGLLFWRSFTHWVGGMGVLAFLIAIVPVLSGEQSINIVKAETPGPAPGKLVPRLRQNAKILYGIYFGLTLLQILLLWAGGMPLYDCVVNAFSTAGTGGFAVKNASIAAYDSLYVEVIITIFMFLFGTNFNIFYFMLIRNFGGIAKSTECKVYLTVVLTASVLIAGNLFFAMAESMGHAIRLSFFQVVSVMSTSGFATADYSLWPQFSKMILFLLALTGACSGSTSGGLKLSRIIILFREARRSLFRLGHPRSVTAVRMDGRGVDRHIIHGVNTYCITFLGLFVTALILVSFDGFDFETTLTSVVATVSNVGPGYGMVSAAGDFSQFSGFSKGVFCMNMLLGRLEIYPVLFLLFPRTWKAL